MRPRRLLAGNRGRWIGLILAAVLLGATLSLGLNSVLRKNGSDVVVASKIATAAGDLSPRPFPQTAPSPGRSANSSAPPNRAGDPRIASALPYEFVVAHYNEPLDWLTPIADRSHVYHKGQRHGAPPLDVYKWEELPNVGREPHTYLHHVIANYDNLADVTVFLQGHGTGVDRAHCFPEPLDFLANARRGVYCKEKPRILAWGRLNHFGKWLVALRRGAMRRARFTLGEFYQAVFGATHPATAPKCLAGCFSATREMLRQHPLDFYRRAISYIDDHPNPEESHYMERLWASVIYLHQAES